MSEAEADTAQGMSDKSGGSDASRIDRRTAMKAALGGAAVAAVWSAPKIEGLSLAPDFAAAASCTTASMAQITKNSNNCQAGATECWGNNCCGNWGFSSSVNATNVNFPLNGNIGGNVNTNGTVTMNVNNIDPPFQRCTVNVAGNCNNGGTFAGGGTFTFNNNGNQNANIDCQGGGSFTQDDPDGQIRINMTCSCNNT